MTGPGGIHGAPADDADAPIWATRWDKRSVILALRDRKSDAANPWTFCRLPKASHTFDPKHGWFTEWPRIREIAPGRLMMIMHGMMFDFPRTFRSGRAGGIRPIAAHLRYIPDFCHWNGKVVLAADDTSIMQNPLAGISQSNLWFGTVEQLKEFGPPAGWGGVWMGDQVKANQASDPYLLAGFEKRVLHLSHCGNEGVEFTLEIDEKGDGQWKRIDTIQVGANSYKPHILAPDLKGEWVRIKADKDCLVSAYFHYLTPAQPDRSDKVFDSLAAAAVAAPSTSGIVRPGGEKQLQFLDQASGAYCEVQETLQFRRIDDAARVAEMLKFAPGARADYSITDDGPSILVRAKSARFRLPGRLKRMPLEGRRLVREVASERYLANIDGTFYEIPRGPDFLRIKPIASHRFAISDFCTWRGLLVLARTAGDAKHDGHYFKSADGKTGLWFGKTDDLWRIGKPTGQGGTWYKTDVRPDEPSDPFLMTNFDRKTLTLSHDSPRPVTFTIEVNFMNNDSWRVYQKIAVAAGEGTVHNFPDGYQAHWVRLIVDQPCKATALFRYE